MANIRHVVVVRKDLQMPPGLLAAQVAHICDGFMSKLLTVKPQQDGVMSIIPTQNELDSLIEAISKFFKTHYGQELLDEAIKRDVRLYKVCNSADTVNNIQLQSRDYWVKIKHDELDDTITYPGAFAKFSLTPAGDWHRAPLIGEHNLEIYERELGISVDEIINLKQNGII